MLSVIDGLGFAGDETRLLNMSRNLRPENFHHSVLTLNPTVYGAVDEYEARRAQFRNAGIVVEDLSELAPERKLSWNGLPGKLYAKTGIYRKAKRLARVVRDLGVDIVDGRLESAGLVGAIAGRWSGTPASITLYGGYSPKSDVTWPWTTRLALRLASSVITDSGIRADQMRRLLKARASKVIVIPNGITKPSSTYTACEMRCKLGLPADPKIRIVGQVGRLVEYKGHEVLIQAAQRVLAADQNVAFLLVGYTRREAYKYRLQSLAAQLGIADRTIITEYAGDIADVWQVIDIHAHASLFDSLPISIAEGMSLARPAVVTDAGGIPEMVLNGKTGIIVPAGDPAALAGALLTLLREPSLASRLGENAKQRYEMCYRPEIMAKALERHFTAMLHARNNAHTKREP